MQTMEILGAKLRKIIGKHHRIGYLNNGASDAYYTARAESDRAVSLAIYLIKHLDSRHQAATLAKAAGMDGYLNLR